MNTMSYQFINTEYIETVSGGDKDTIKELVDIFRIQVDEIAKEMRSLLEKGDSQSLGMLAHKAKSSVAIMGMNDLAALLKTFELESKTSQNTGNYKMYIDRYEYESGKAVLELEDYLNKL
jgi:HPt (histidine-containing phosphotransfer) domain-containing protein